MRHIVFISMLCACQAELSPHDGVYDVVEAHRTEVGDSSWEEMHAVAYMRLDATRDGRLAWQPCARRNCDMSFVEDDLSMSQWDDERGWNVRVHGVYQSGMCGLQGRRVLFQQVRPGTWHLSLEELEWDQRLGREACDRGGAPDLWDTPPNAGTIRQWVLEESEP